MLKIEAGLHAHHATVAAEMTSVSTAEGGDNANSAVIQTPFAKINSVAPDSPAAEAGMQKGDYIKKFGSVNALNHEKLKKLTELVSSNEGVYISIYLPKLPNGRLTIDLDQKSISVLLSRKETGSDVDREVSIVPRLWAGAGKLGCHILPL